MLDTKTELGKKIICLKGDSLQTKATKTMTKRKTQMTMMAKMMNKTMMTIDQFDSWYLTLNFTMNFQNNISSKLKQISELFEPLFL